MLSAWLLFAALSRGRGGVKKEVIEARVGKKREQEEVRGAT